MRFSLSNQSLILWSAAFLAALGSAAVVHASPPSLVEGVPAAAALLSARHVGPSSSPPRFVPNVDKQLDLAKRSANSNGHPDLTEMSVLKTRAVANLQFFSGALASIQAPAVSQSNDVTRPFAVDSDTFTDYQSAIDRSCDNQHNSCADAANSQKSSSFTVGDCDTQNTQCKAAATSATQTAFTKLTSSTSEFDIFCDL